MLLAVDIGNTNLTLGLYVGAARKASWRLQTVHARTVDEHEMWFRGLLQTRGYTPEAIGSSIVASVVPVLTETVAATLTQMLGGRPLVVGPGMRTGVPVRYSPAGDVGADRIVNAVAAFERFRGACIIVDFGTATTFDCVSARGEYVGGAIAPGVGLSMAALFAHTAKLPKVDVARPEVVVGRTTVESIQSGAFFGYVGLVDGLVRRIKAEMAEPAAKVLATGGLAPVIAADAETIDEVDEYLTLEGLRLLYERNQDPASRTLGSPNSRKMDDDP